MPPQPALSRHRPCWVGEVDLAHLPPVLYVRPAPDGTGPYGRARVLVRAQGEPVAMLTVATSDGTIDGSTVTELAASEAGDILAAQLGADWRRRLAEGVGPVSAGLAAVALGDPPPVTVVIGTRNRADHATACVARVLAQDYPAAVEVVVVDNGSASTATRDLLTDRFGGDPRVRYLREERKGLSRARNQGLAAASHPVVAFLSDDILVDPLWLRAVIRGFRRAPGVGCVVGYVPPLHLDTPEQLVFEQTMAWGWRNGFAPRLVGPDSSGDPLHPYRLGLANGANVAFDTEAFRARGGFDERLGPGTPARGGEDLDAPVRVLLDGGSVAFEPAALGWHADRYDDRTFAAHLYTYGLGLTAFLTAHLLDPSTRPVLVRRMPHGLGHLLRPAVLPRSAARLDGAPLPLRCRIANLAGRLAGPVAFLRSARANRRSSLPSPRIGDDAGSVPPVRSTPMKEQPECW